MIAVKQLDQININLDFEIINQLNPRKPAAFQLTNCSQPNEVIKLLLTHSALKSFHNLSHQSNSSIESKREEIIALLNNSNLFRAEKEILSNDYIEWSLTSGNLTKKRQHFRELISLYKTFDVRHPSITIQIIEIIQYYIKEYLFQQENFSNDYIHKLEEYFQEALRKQDYFLYFIKAYTMTGNFHYALNKHLALYIIDYFDPSTYMSQPGKYRLINCLAHITGLSLNYPHIHRYQYRGVTYRGLIINKQDLECYSIGNFILNRSFVSTSKDRSVAIVFSAFEQENDSTKVCVLFKYKIESNATGLDIERISSIKEEKEVIILPFSVFQVKHRKEIRSNKSSQILHEIHLEECQDQQSVDKYRIILKSKYFYIFIVLCMIISVFLITNYNIVKSKKAQKQRTFIQWKQHAITVAGGNERGDDLNQLWHPHGIYIHDQIEVIYIADSHNHRIIAWMFGENRGIVVAGDYSQGNKINQLYWPTDLVLDENNSSLIICDSGNKRIVQWSLERQQDIQILIKNISCYGLMMNRNNGDLFISDRERHEVKRWRKNEKEEGTIVAGGNGIGDQLNQLDYPTFIFVDREETVYVSDCSNHRVMKWLKGAQEGIIVAGGFGGGNSSNQLSYPQGLFINRIGDVYVADYDNNRIMCWPLGSQEGHIVVGGNGDGNESNQLINPISFSFDQHINLYVTDVGNSRIQKFELDRANPIFS